MRMPLLFTGVLTQLASVVPKALRLAVVARAIFLGVFIIYQVYRLSFRPSVGLSALTVFDALISGLSFREYRKQLALVQR